MYPNHSLADYVAEGASTVGERDVIPPADPPVPLRWVDNPTLLAETRLDTFRNKRIQFVELQHECPGDRLREIYCTDTDLPEHHVHWNTHTAKRADGFFDVTYLACIKAPDQTEFDVTQYSLEFDVLNVWHVHAGDGDLGVDTLELLPPGASDTGPVLAAVLHQFGCKCITFVAKPPRVIERVKIRKYARLVKYRAGFVCYWPRLLRCIAYVDERGTVDLFSLPYVAPKHLCIVGNCVVADNGLMINGGTVIGTSDSGALLIVHVPTADRRAMLITAGAYPHKRDRSTALESIRVYAKPQVLAASDQGFVITEEGEYTGRAVTLFKFTAVVDAADSIAAI